MLVVVYLVIGILLLVPAIALWVRRQYLFRKEPELSPITLQHLELFQGGELNEEELESTKTRFRSFLEQGDVASVEKSLQGGMQYVVQVRALAELGTEDACQILERQLHKRQSEDQMEQTWFWIDLASGLRVMNRAQSLPPLLRTADEALDKPLGRFLAAETICFFDFQGYLQQIQTPLGRSAVKILRGAMEGLRQGMSPLLIGESRLGELVENLWDYRGTKADPLVAGVFFEALRILRRAEWLKESLDGDASEKEGFDWQVSRLAALEPSLREYLQKVPKSFRAQLPNAPQNRQKELLAILLELRADGGEAVMDMAKSRVSPLTEQAIQLLRWSKDPQAGALLRDLVLQGVPMVKRAQHRPRSWRRPNRLPTPPLPYAPILRALRGHPCAQTEAILLLAARDWDPRYRQAAVSSLGWWEPIQQKDVLLTLQDSRRDPSGEVRLAARSALARLGERQSLAWFKQCLQSEDLGRVYDTMQEIVQEGLTLLWPEMDKLSEAESPEIAHQARECLECLSENLTSTPGF